MAVSGVVVLMCGLPCSGKTTYAKALQERGYARLSIDEVVWQRTRHDPARIDPGRYARLQTEVEARLWGELIRLLRARRPVVLDYSFARRARRDRYRALIASHGCRCELVYLKADLATAHPAGRPQPTRRPQRRHRLGRTA